jgi:hypothetical protein
MVLGAAEEEAPRSKDNIVKAKGKGVGFFV